MDEPTMTPDELFRLLGEKVAEADYWKRRALRAEAGKVEPA